MGSAISRCYIAVKEASRAFSRLSREETERVQAAASVRRIDWDTLERAVGRVMREEAEEHEHE